MEMESLQDLFIEELKDMYHAEKQLVKALPKMAKAATSEELQNAFTQHLEETRGHVEMVEQIFALMDRKPATKVCKGMQGIIEEGSEVIEEDSDEEVKDAALIAAGQRAEHYEMAAYGCLRTYARVMGNKKAEKILQTILDQEGAADQLLTKLAESGINVAAV